jgi:tetratricopeptide (TPR) repeat protein
MLRQVMSKWPDEDYRVNIRLASIERLRGNYDESLRLLNLVSAKYPMAPGMRFYFHRGWTLTKLQRYDEAIADFTEGLKDQPDYGWANARRACALGQLGQLKPALADIQTAIGSIEQDPAANQRNLKHDLARLHAIDGLLNAAIDAGSTAPMPAVCEGFWSKEEARQPSRYLPH